MRKLIVSILALALVIPAAGALAAQGEWTGFITDTHCGEKGATKTHTLGCVEKCMKAGSNAQILNESDKKIYDLDGVDKVKTLIGKKVTVKGTLDTKTNTIAVESAAEVTASEAK